jgi:hypothetical protein
MSASLTRPHARSSAPVVPTRQSTEVLFQFVDFLLQHMPADEYAALVPSLSVLADTFGLSPSLAFHILRPKLASEVRKVDAEKARDASRAKEARLKQEMMDRKRAAASTPPVVVAAEPATTGTTASDVVPVAQEAGATTDSVASTAVTAVAPAPVSPTLPAKSTAAAVSLPLFVPPLSATADF